MEIQSITFRAGASPSSDALRLTPKRVTVFIGPNNGGKSKALAEIRELVAPVGYLEPVVVSECQLAEMSSSEVDAKFALLLSAKAPGENADPGVQPLGRRGQRNLVSLEYVRGGLLSTADTTQRQYAATHFLVHFTINLGGEGRLALANPAAAQALGMPASSTIGTLFKNNELRQQLSSIVYDAFNQYLVVDPTGMTQLEYKLSDTAPSELQERSLTDEAVAFFSNASPLRLASDGTKAFAGILGEVIAGDPDLIFIDEPEAFLHPSLAFMLGSRIARNVSQGKQLFAATHSSHFLMGCLLSGIEVDVVRLTHRNGAASARHLSAARLKSLMADPLFRSIGVITALFYEFAVVVEGDTDRAFYDEVNDRLLRYSTDGIPHVTFLNAHNKQTASNIVVPLREVGIPAAFILDLDWIKEDGQVFSRYVNAAGIPEGLRTSVAAARRSVRASLEKVDADYKRNGGLDLLNDSDRQTADAFFDQMEEYGLFTVRKGELESWLATLQLERTKNKWLVSAFEKMGSEPTDANYIKPDADDVWAFVRRIKLWAFNVNRRGMGLQY